MSIAICCPGPSLSTHPLTTLKTHKTVVAVNRAILYTHPVATHWAFLDWPVFTHCVHTDKAEPQIPADLTILTDQKCSDQIRDTAHPHASRWHWATVFAQVRAQRKTAGIHPKHARYTMTCALTWAWRLLGEKNVYLYGCDLAGTKDFDGAALPGVNRGQNRWGLESIVLDAMTKQAKEEGCMIRRVQAVGPDTEKATP